MIKTDSLGNFEWENTFAGPNGETYEGVFYDVKQTADGGYILAGTSEPVQLPNPDYWYVVKTDSAGNLQWDEYAPGFWDCRLVFQRENGNYCLIATQVAMFWSIVLIELAPSGQVIDEYYTYETNLRAYAALPSADDGYFIAGSFGNYGPLNALFCRVDSVYNMSWYTDFGIAAVNEIAYAIAPTNDGGFFLGGFQSQGSHDDVYLVKTVLDSLPVWEQNYGGSGNEQCRAVLPSPSGDLLAAGYTSSIGAGGYDGFLLAVDQAGILQWSAAYGGSGSDYIHAMVLAPDGRLILAGETESFGAGGKDMWLVALAGENLGVATAPEQPNLPQGYALLAPHPNPFNANCQLTCLLPQTGQISLDVYDLSGGKVAALADGWHSAGQYHATFSAGALPAGLYFARLTAGRFQQTQKMLLLK